MKLKFLNEEWQYIMNLVESNVASEKQMLNFYNNKNNNVVEKQVEDAVNRLNPEEAKNLNINAIKGIVDLQTRIFIKYKTQILDSIKLSKELFQTLDRNKIECSKDDCDKLIRMLKLEIEYNKTMFEEMKEQKEAEIFEGVCEMYKEEYDEKELENPEVIKYLKQEVKNYFEQDKDAISSFADLKSEVTDRELAIEKLEESKIEAMN